MAVRFPATGGVPNETVKVVAVAVVTVPTAPLLNKTVLLLDVVLNPNPRIVRVVVDPVMAAVLAVTDGITAATCIGLPFEIELVVTAAVKLPTAVGFVSIRTVRDVAVAAVTTPTAPLLNKTVFRVKIGSKPNPLMTTLAAPAERLVVLAVTTGTMFATCTNAMLAAPLTVTVAFKLPADTGLVERFTVKDVEVAVVTVPTAPLLKTTVFREAVVSKPEPAIVIVVVVTA